MCDYACLKTRYAIRRRISRYGGIPRSLYSICACHVGQQIPAQYAVNAVNIPGHVMAHDVFDMPRGPLALPNGHVDPTAHIKRTGRIFRLQPISRVSHFPPPKATSRAYIYMYDVSRGVLRVGPDPEVVLGALPASTPCFGSVFYNKVPKRIETPENWR
jgi:hypothetical protein